LGCLSYVFQVTRYGLEVKLNKQNKLNKQIKKMR
jgi:hypothetical protein